jgi:mono/diheme cytochrome c family protein
VTTRPRLALLAPLALLALASCGDDAEELPDAAVDSGVTADASHPDAGPQPSSARGAYLVAHVAACGDCHTPRIQGVPDQERYLAGVPCFVDVNGPVEGGCLHTPNLTSDVTGLANVSDEQLTTMLVDGIRPNGDPLVPMMPYWIYHNMTELDVASIVLYLRSVDPVENAIPANDPEFPVPDDPAEPLDPDADIPMPQTVNERTMNGRYLAAMAGACIDCHTSLTDELDFRSLDLASAFAGSRAFSRASLGLPDLFPEIIYSANITPDETGIIGYSVDDIVEVLKSGETPTGAGLCPPMPAGQMAAFGGLTDEDAADIGEFVLGLAPIEKVIPNDCSPP